MKLSVSWADMNVTRFGFVDNHSYARWFNAQW